MDNDRDWRRLLVLPFLEPSSKLASEISRALRKLNTKPEEYAREEEGKRLAEVQAEAKRIAQYTLHVLLPRPDWWERPFTEWSEADWAICGYSAYWNLATGELRWAVGGADRGDMQAKGLPIEEFLKSSQLAEFRTRCPELFPEAASEPGDDE